MFAVLASSTTFAPGHSGTPPRWGGHRSPQGTTNARRKVTISRASLDTPWGFRLQGGKDFNTPLSIKRVFSGSPADGKLTRDDLILAINDEPVNDLLHGEILDKIKSAGQSIAFTIESGDSDWDYSYRPTAFATNDTSRQGQQQHQQQQQQQQQQIKHAHTPPQDYETKAPSQYASYQSPSGSSRPTSHEPSAADNRRTAAAPVTKPKSTRRYQASATVPMGLMEMGWSPKPKPVPLSGQPEPNAQRYPREAPRQQTHADSRRSDQFNEEQQQGVPAWYGSLRSARAPHAYEVRAAQIDTPPEYVSQQHARKEHGESQEAPGRTYKAEIRGLMLARPAYSHAQSTPEPSTPEWEETHEERIYPPRGQAHSAPETPEAEKLQPSVLFGAKAANRVVQPTLVQPTPVQPTPKQTVVTLRTQPQTMSTVVSTRAETRREVVMPVTKAQPVQRVVAAPKEVKPINVVSAAAAPERPHVVQGIVEKPQHLHEQFVPVPDRLPTQKQAPAVAQFTAAQTARAIQVHDGPKVSVERFNPVPTRPQITAHVSDGPVKYPLQERFNPVPERPKRPTDHGPVTCPVRPVQQHISVVPEKPKVATTKVPEKSATSPIITVERFNPVPNRPKTTTTPTTTMVKVPPGPAKHPVENVSPVPSRPTTTTKVSEGSAKHPIIPVERFNPVPHRPITATAKVPPGSAKHQIIAVERFNPVPSRPTKV